MPVPIEQKLGNHNLIEIVCVGGVNQPQPVALVMLAEDVRQQLTQGSSRTEIEKELNALLIEINKDLEPHERLDYIVMTQEPWTMENDLLTPTMKIKRNKIEAKYQDKLEGWLGRKSPVIWE